MNEGYDITKFSAEKAFVLPEVRNGHVVFTGGATKKDKGVRTGEATFKTSQLMKQVFPKTSDRIEASIEAVRTCRNTLKATGSAQDEQALLTFVTELKKKVLTDLQNANFKSVRFSRSFGGLGKLEKLENELVQALHLKAFENIDVQVMDKASCAKYFEANTRGKPKGFMIRVEPNDPSKIYVVVKSIRHEKENYATDKDRPEEYTAEREFTFDGQKFTEVEGDQFSGNHTALLDHLKKKYGALNMLQTKAPYATPEQSAKRKGHPEAGIPEEREQIIPRAIPLPPSTPSPTIAAPPRKPSVHTSPQPTMTAPPTIATTSAAATTPPPESAPKPSTPKGQEYSMFVPPPPKPVVRTSPTPTTPPPAVTVPAPKKAEVNSDNLLALSSRLYKQMSLDNAHEHMKKLSFEGKVFMLSQDKQNPGTLYWVTATRSGNDITFEDDDVTNEFNELASDQVTNWVQDKRTTDKSIPIHLLQSKKAPKPKLLHKTAAAQKAATHLPQSVPVSTPVPSLQPTAVPAAQVRPKAYLAGDPGNPISDIPLATAKTKLETLEADRIPPKEKSAFVIVKSPDNKDEYHVAAATYDKNNKGTLIAEGRITKDPEESRYEITYTQGKETKTARVKDLKTLGAFMKQWWGKAIFIAP